jgi:RimJ/RimL family protein N-acetyltransferase
MLWKVVPPRPPTFTLEGPGVRLEPLSIAHVPDLVRAASGGRDTFALTFVPDGEVAMRAYVDVALAARDAGDAVPFVTFDKALGRVVGSTRFGYLERWTWPASSSDAPTAPDTLDAAEIGWTWLAAEAQRTRVNTEQKLMMLRHAFEAWRVHRITLITDARNARSRAAIERLGASFEGVRRAHFPAADGTIRDSATYSILRAEWPVVFQHLASRLGPIDPR